MCRERWRIWIVALVARIADADAGGGGGQMQMQVMMMKVLELALDSTEVVR